VNTKRYISKLKVTASSLLLLAVTFLFACESNKPEEIQAITNLEEQPSLIFRTLETTISDSALIKYRFIAPEVIQYDRKREQPYIDFPKGLHLLIYNSDQVIEAQIKCNVARYLMNEKLWELKNNVEAVNFKAEVINTELLYWDETKALIYSDQYVKITRQTETLTGNGFRSNQDLSEYTILKPKGSLEIDEQ
jgi:LPS export ABC transporter protein LptC